MHLTEFPFREFAFGVLLASGALGVSAQSIYVPPSPWPDGAAGNITYVQNKGQRFDTNGAQRNEIKFYTRNSPIRLDLAEKSKVSYTLPIVDTDSSSMDTLYRVDMDLIGRERLPVSLETAPGLLHFYRAELSVTGATQHHRAVYHSVWDSVDVHFTHGVAGPRMAIVVRPGGNPDDIKLSFTGQDSLKVDLEGALKMYVVDKSIQLDEAIAYQVGSSGGIQPLGWMATYEHQDGTPFVKLGFQEFNSEKPLVLLIGHPPLAMGGNGGSPQGNLTWSTTVGSEYSTFNQMGDMILGGDKLPDNDLVVTGMTADDAFPAATGASVSTVRWDVFTSRFRYAPGDANNDARLLWTTFLTGQPSGIGGPGGDDAPTSIKYVAQHNAIYVAGSTSSGLWPTWPIPQPSDYSYYQTALLGQQDAFIAKLDLSGALLRSSYYGGNGSDIINTITADAFGRVFFFGTTSTTTGSGGCGSTLGGLPLCDPGVGNHQQNNNAGGLDMFVARFDADFELTWGSFIGGPGDDRVVDSDYISGFSETDDWVGIAGCSNGNLPYQQVTGCFQLQDNTLTDAPNGFLWLFRSMGRAGWGTHVHGTDNLQAILLTKDEVRAAGVTIKAPPVAFIQETCDAVGGYLSVCNGNPNTSYISNYLAEFSTNSFTMEWSTLLGESVDARHALVTSRYWRPLFDTDRFMDLVANPVGDYLLASTVAKQPFSELNQYDMQPAWGMYNKAWDTMAGDSQTDVVLSLFRNDNELAWSSAFGGAVAHVGELYDWGVVERGSDLVHSMVWSPNHVLYLVGSSGGNDFDRQCPYPPPGPSYCELTAGPVDGIVDRFDGMIARFDMREISIGLHEQQRLEQLTLYPTPTRDQLTLAGPSWLNTRCVVRIADVAGRLAWQQPLPADLVLPVHHLAPGVYTLQVAAHGTTHLATTRFVKQ